MRRCRLALLSPVMAVATTLLLANAIPAGAEMPTVRENTDLAEIPRTIIKEPVYQTDSPGYCLLVFGPEAKTRIWLVADGKDVYIDRNGNGDLTEDGERVGSQEGGWFLLRDVTEADGKTEHEDLRIKVMEDSSFELKLRSPGNIRQHVGRVESFRPQLAAKPADAPIIHPNGPLTLAPYTPINFAFRSADDDRDTQFEWLNLVAGSSGLGPGTFTLTYPVKRVGCAGSRKVLAEIEFPPRDPDAPPIIAKQALMTEG